MDCMVNKRLVYESTNSQCNFRNQTSTMDHMVRLEISIREANIEKNHHISVLEKIYETTWKYDKMKDIT